MWTPKNIQLQIMDKMVLPFHKCQNASASGDFTPQSPYCDMACTPLKTSELRPYVPLPSTLRKNFSNPALSEVNQKSRKSVKMFLRYRQPNLVAYYFGPPGRYREIDNLTFNKYN